MASSQDSRVREPSPLFPRRPREHSDPPALRGVVDELREAAPSSLFCIGAKSAGMHSAFIDRRRRLFGGTAHEPDIVVPDMKSLADMIV